ncbi:hypothetical protein COY25_03700 [Candidatus Uhrbacteria bacterium CG_4_10_14_0_2_um_filter_41_7]|nr:MAG: hypothetical protein COY25_03700 [Candidatus Uhrbacteria bacterium CG_4_10_14_0_2_um_filter_41_7]
MKNLHNPFKTESKITRSNTETANAFLSPDDAAAYVALLEEQKPPEEEGSFLGNFEMSAEQQQAVEKRSEKPWDRGLMLDWAINIGFSEEWFDKTFNKNKNGTWFAPNGLDLEKLDIRTLPKGITEIHGELKLGTTSAEHLNLPEGLQKLYLNSLTSAKHLNLPEGLQELHLSSLTSLDGIQLPSIITGEWWMWKITKKQFDALNYTGKITGRINLSDGII